MHACAQCLFYLTQHIEAALQDDLGYIHFAFPLVMKHAFSYLKEDSLSEYHDEFTVRVFAMFMKLGTMLGEDSVAM